MVVAYPASAARRAEIAQAELIHVSPARHRGAIIQADGGPLPDHANCRIHLKAGQGWSVAPFRLLRDYSIADPYLNHLSSWGCYSYFFVGDPSWWAVKKNIGPFARWGDLGPDLTVYRIAGADMVADAELLFYRPDDRVLILRGDYTGPAWVEPPP